MYLEKKKKDLLNNETHPYDVVLDELLVAEEDLLSAEDGGLGPGGVGPGAGVRRRQHLRLSGLRYAADHLVGRLDRKEVVTTCVCVSKG